MSGARRVEWPALGRWGSIWFLGAGGLLFVATVINGLDAFTPLETQAGLWLHAEAVAGFGGVALSFAGLLSLRPRLADVSPRLARTGVWLAVGPTAFFVTLLVVCTAVAGLLDLPSVKVLVPAFDVIVGTVVLLFAAGLFCFGGASLRTAVPSRSIGVLLLVAALAWVVFFGALQVYGYETPTWVTFGQTATMAGVMLGIGWRLRTGPDALSRTVAAVRGTSG